MDRTRGSTTGVAAASGDATGDGALARVARSIPAALLCAVIALVYAVADATLLFGTSFPEHVSTGLGMALVGGAVVAGVVAFGSGLPGTIAGAQGVTVVMLAVMVADIDASFPAGSDRDVVFVTAVAAVIVATLLVGIGCHLVARLRLGRFVHYVPWPVVAGLLGGSGLTLVVAALPILTGRESLASLAGGFAPARDLPALALGAVAAGALAVAAHRRASGVALVATLVLGYVGWRGIAHFAGLDLDVLRADGWTLAAAPRAVAWPPPGLVSGLSAAMASGPDAPAAIDWARLAARVPFMGAVVVITLLATLVKVGAIGQMLDREVDEGRELRAAGTANLLAGGAMGLPGFHAVSLTRIASRMRAERALTALLVAAFTLCALPFAGAVLAHAPRFLVGGALLWIGADLVATWLVQPRASLSAPEFGIVLTIAAAIVALGFLPGLLVGVGATLVLFVLDYGRIDMLRAAVPHADLRSNVDRTAAERELLAEHADALIVLRLHGYLFFGTAHRLVDQLRTRLDAREPVPRVPSCVVVDLAQVTGLDVSAVRALDRLCALARRRGLELAFCARPGSRRTMLERLVARHRRDGGARPLAFDTLDDALQHREEGLLAGLHPTERTDFGRFVHSLGQPAIHRLTRYADALSIDAGQTLLREGRTTGALFLVREGRLAVRLAGTGAEVRLRSVGPGALLGELSFYLGRPASADVVAETRSRLWRITAETLDRMLAEDPTLASRFHRHVSTVLAERLVDNGRQIRMLAD